MMRRFEPGDRQALAALFDGVLGDPTAANYNPHPFTEGQAALIAGYRGNDVYLGAWVKGVLAGYGMLRGWDQGYAVPSLGIYVAPAHRGTGLAKRIMHALRAMAEMRDAPSIRLRVREDNAIARRLYEACGYEFDGTIERGELLGVLPLTHMEAA